jgi:hypothetical protein
MRMTPKQLRLLSGLLVLAGAIVDVLTEGKGRYVGIGIMVVGIILLMPWIKEKKE